MLLHQISPSFYMWIFWIEYMMVLTNTRPFLYLFESTVQVELPPIKMVGIEREIIIFSAVTGVGQNVAAAFGKAKKDMPGTKKVTQHCLPRLSLKNIRQSSGWWGIPYIRLVLKVTLISCAGIKHDVAQPVILLNKWDHDNVNNQTMGYTHFKSV